MFRKSFVTSILVMLAFGLSPLTNSTGARVKSQVSAALTQQQQQEEIDCANKDAVYRAIYNTLKSDANLTSQLKHINFSFSVIRDASGKAVKDIDGNIVFSKDEITLRGWAFAAKEDRDKMSAVNQVEALVRKATKCAAKVNRDSLYKTKGPKCPDNQKPCGDLCIPKEEDCNIPPPIQ